VKDVDAAERPDGAVDKPLDCRLIGDFSYRDDRVVSGFSGIVSVTPASSTSTARDARTR